MTTKRSVLDLLARDELLGLVDTFQLEPKDRRVKTALAEAVSASNGATLGAFLPTFSRDCLKALWRALDLDDGLNPGERPA